MGDQERRRDSRVNFHVQATVNIGEKELSSLPIEDLSVRGVFICCDETPALDSQCKVKIMVAGSTSQLDLRLQGRVARLTEKGFAVEFRKVDLDSFVFLQNVVKYNQPAEDAEDESGIE